MERRRLHSFYCLVGLFVAVLLLDSRLGWGRRSCQRSLLAIPILEGDVYGANTTAFSSSPFHNASRSVPALLTQHMDWNLEEHVPVGNGRALSFRIPPFQNASLTTPELVTKYVEWSKFLPSGLPVPLHSGKHFREVSTRIPHLDLRYYRPGMGLEQSIVDNLRHLFRAWSEFAETELKAAGISYWLAHGALLGWYWGAHIMPWDDDLDIQMAVQDIYALARYNMTLVAGRYLLEVNPQITNRWAEAENSIDARFIDTQTAVFIDITGLSFAGYEGNNTIVSCKSVYPRPHRYNLHRLLPLVQTTFEEVPAWVSNDFENHLTREYRRFSLINYEFKGYRFNLQTLRWEWNGSMPYVRSLRVGGRPFRFP